MADLEKPVVDIIMGSDSDFETMQHCSVILTTLGIRHRVGVISAHRTPEWLSAYAKNAEEAGIEIIIAGAGGSAALAGDIACRTYLPVLGVPIESTALRGLDALLSIHQLPAGTPVGGMPIGVAGAKNAAHFVGRLFATREPRVREHIQNQQRDMRTTVQTMNTKLPLSGLAEPILLDWLSEEEKT